MNLGERVKDSINGFSGVITARAEYLYGCIRYLVEPQDLDEKGQPKESQWIDEQRLLFRSADEPAASAAGGPQKDAPRS